MRDPFKNNRGSKELAANIMAVLGGLVIVLHPVGVWAHQNPGGCNGNRLNLAIVKDRTSIMQGETINYTVTVSNVDAEGVIACDITAADVAVTLPAQDGTPTGTVVNLATNVSYPAGTPLTVLGAIPYVVDVNPGVVDVVAEARAEGDLHDAPVDHAALIVKTIGTQVVTPAPAAGSGADTGSGLPGLPNTGSMKS